MENASKALIISGSILIALLVISLGIVVFNKMKQPAQDMANLDAEQISAFNSKLNPYIGKNISGTQVNALIQTVMSINLKANSDNDAVRRVSIIFPAEDGKTVTLKKDGTYLNVGTSKRVITGNKFYSVNVSNKNGGLITEITVTQ